MAAKRAIVSFLTCPRIAVVDDERPFMFLSDTGWVHGVHRFFRRLRGRLPR